MNEYLPRFRPVLFALLLAAVTSIAAAQETQPHVMFFGTFHFQDAGLDQVKVEDIDVMSTENQAYLEGLTDRLAMFQPSHVLLEYNPENESLINDRYRAYLADEYELGANEIYQLGFRIARKAGLEALHSFDHREVQWAFEPLAAYGEANDDPAWNAVRAVIAEVQAGEAQARETLTFAELLQRQNDPENERLNRDLYLMTNAMGVDGSWVGANATSSWWERNFRMYARVQKHATPGARIIAIGGAGHTAILKQLLATDSRIEAEDPRPYLEPNPGGFVSDGATRD